MMAARRKIKKEKPAVVLYVNDLILLDDGEYTGFVKTLEDIATEYPEMAVRLIINSSGGDPAKGFGIFDCVRRLNLDVETIVQGEAASAASVVALAGNVRKITRFSSIMIHRAKIMCSNQTFWQPDLELLALEFQKINQFTMDIVHERTGLPRARVEKDYEKGTRYYAEEALKLGFVHEIV